MKKARALRIGLLAAGIGAASYGAYSLRAWAMYGHVHSDRHPKDDLLDRFLPEPEVDEYHHFKVNAPAAITFEAAKKMDLQASPLVKTIFWLRGLPAMLKGVELRPEGPRGIIEETLANGWGVLAEVPGREIVIGAYTQPWHEKVTFNPLPPAAFASFAEPGYVKIVVTFAAEPLSATESRFVTRTRVATTDPLSRKKFRLYWAPMSAGIILIRYLSLPLIRGAAERNYARTLAVGSVERSGPSRAEGIVATG
jgi:hypothetical protein